MQPAKVEGSQGVGKIAILDLSNALSRKRCNKLVLITNRKSHYELSIGTKLGDLG